MDISTLPTYVINLKKREDRWGRFIAQPGAHTLKKLKRFNAVNGKEIAYKGDKRIALYTKLNILRNYRRSHYEIATLGAVGSSLSHIGVWRKFLASGADYCLVLEDDAVLTEDQLKSVQEASADLPPNWGIWLVGHYRPSLYYAPIAGAAGPWNRVYNFTGAHAYILRRDAAKKLLDECLPVHTHIEYYMTACSILKDFCIVETPRVHIEFFRKEQFKARTYDSNTSQHKRRGCPSCDSPDDFSQIYRRHTRRTEKGMRVGGLVDGQQSSCVRRLRSRTRKNLR